MVEELGKLGTRAVIVISAGFAEIGANGAAAVDLVKLALVRVSQLVADFAEIKELDINPLLVDANSITALDGRIRIAESKQPPEERLAIRPYSRSSFNEN